MTKPTPQPKSPTITLRAGKLSATVPAELLPALLNLAPAVRQVGEGFARVRATIERDTPNG